MKNAISCSRLGQNNSTQMVVSCRHRRGVLGKRLDTRVCFIDVAKYFNWYNILGFVGGANYYKK